MATTMTNPIIDKTTMDSLAHFGVNENTELHTGRIDLAAPDNEFEIGVCPVCGFKHNTKTLVRMYFDGNERNFLEFVCPECDTSVIFAVHSNSVLEFFASII